MSDIGYDRCPNDDVKIGTTPVGVNPDTGQPVELNINGVAAVTAIQSALFTVGAALRNGHEEDFLEKVALCLFGELTNDRHALCPLLTVCLLCLHVLTQRAGVTFDKEGHVVIAPLNVHVEPGPVCMFGDETEEGKGLWDG